MLSRTLFHLSPDFLGGVLSFLCLIHCLMLPWMAALLPVTLISDESVHVWLFLALGPAAAMAGWGGLREHRRHLPVLLMASGVLLVGSAVFAPINQALEVPITVTGSALLIAGHIHNGRMKRVHRIVMQNP